MTRAEDYPEEKPTVLFQMKASSLDRVIEKGLGYEMAGENLSVVIDDVPPEYVDGTYSDPVKEICSDWQLNPEDVIEWEEV